MGGERSLRLSYSPAMRPTSSMTFLALLAASSLAIGCAGLPQSSAQSPTAAPAPVAQKRPLLSDAAIEKNIRVLAAAEDAAADFTIGHPEASEAEVIAAATVAAQQAGGRDAQDFGKFAANGAKEWIATRKLNGFPPLTTPAELAANDAAAERRYCAEMAAEGNLDCSAHVWPRSEGAHYFPKIGTCFDTQVASVASRLEAIPSEDIPSRGEVVRYADGHIQVSYDTSRVVQAFHVGDQIRLCVTDLPGHCPPADDRGIVFVAINGRTGGRWMAPDSEHPCGGA
jgi:hypothetical protein